MTRKKVHKSVVVRKKKVHKPKVIWKGKTSQEQLNRIAATVRRSALTVVRNAFNDYDELDMLHIFLDDAKDMVRVSHYLVEGQVKKAANKAWSMDTAARDELPPSFWNMVEREGLD